MALLCEFRSANAPWPLYIQYLTEVILPPSQNFLRIRKEIAPLILYHISFKLVTLLKFSYATIQVSDVLILTAYFNIIILPFKYSLFLFLKRLLTSLFTSRKLSSFTILGSCIHCSLACFLRSTDFKHSSSKHGIYDFDSQCPIPSSTLPHSRE
jgi:hypothetical protein